MRSRKVRHTCALFGKDGSDDELSFKPSRKIAQDTSRLRRLLCPCARCKNREFVDPRTLHRHMFCYPPDDNKQQDCVTNKAQVEMTTDADNETWDDLPMGDSWIPEIVESMETFQQTRTRRRAPPDSPPEPARCLPKLKRMSTDAESSETYWNFNEIDNDNTSSGEDDGFEHYSVTDDFEDYSPPPLFMSKNLAIIQPAEFWQFHIHNIQLLWQHTFAGRMTAF